ncbi:MAG: hypothetical protein HEQ23_05115 [Tepidisphaera sp.]
MSLPQPKMPSTRGDPPDAVPRRYAVFLAACTVLTMALGLGRDDQTRGPLWHMMWILSLVVVLATLAGSLARRSRGAAATAMRSRKPAHPAMPTPTESPSPS